MKKVVKLAGTETVDSNARAELERLERGTEGEHLRGRARNHHVRGAHLEHEAEQRERGAAPQEEAAEAADVPGVERGVLDLTAHGDQGEYPRVTAGRTTFEHSERGHPARMRQGS